jgi:N-acyl homoserine lactone hydrolase
VVARVALADRPSAITPETCLEARLKSLGLGPEDFRYVVQGHLHTDHAGGLRLFQQAGTTVLVHEDELNHVANIASAENFFNRQDWAFIAASSRGGVVKDVFGVTA